MLSAATILAMTPEVVGVLPCSCCFLLSVGTVLGYLDVERCTIYTNALRAACILSVFNKSGISH